VELTGRNNALAFTPPDRDAGAGARAKPSAKKTRAFGDDRMRERLRSNREWESRL